MHRPAVDAGLPGGAADQKTVSSLSSSFTEFFFLFRCQRPVALVSDFAVLRFFSRVTLGFTRVVTVANGLYRVSRIFRKKNRFFTFVVPKFSSLENQLNSLFNCISVNCYMLWRVAWSLIELLRLGPSCSKLLSHLPMHRPER